LDYFKEALDSIISFVIASFILFLKKCS